MANDIVAQVQKAGVVGAGGAGFPTHVKIGSKAEIIVANGAECEPLLRAHQELMARESVNIVSGLLAVKEVTGAKRALIALKQKYSAAITSLQKAINEHAGGKIELYILKDFYPAGDEQVLVYETTGLIVPEGGIPLNVGVVVVNVETLYNISQAVVGIPVTDKFVTVAGAVHHPFTVRVPLGIKLAELITLAGGANIVNYRIIDGGPLMGKLVDENFVVTKTTGGIIVLPQDHPIVTQRKLSWRAIANRAKAVCCNCRACTDCCPRHLLGHSLEPHKVMQAVGGGLEDTKAIIQAVLCSDCGVCDNYACTMGLSPRRINMELKKHIRKEGIKNLYHNLPDKVQSDREYRRIPSKRMIARLGLQQYDVKAPLQEMAITPKEVKLPLVQHIGSPSVPLVKIGDLVKRGDLIAGTQDNKMGVNLHASIDGEVYCLENAVFIRAAKVRTGVL